MMQRTKFLLLFSLIFLCCEKQIPGISEEEKMRFLDITVKLAILKENPIPDNTVYTDSARSIIRNHQFTEEQYDRILAHYEKHPLEWESFFREFLTRLNASSASSIPGKSPAFFGQQPPR